MGLRLIEKLAEPVVGDLDPVIDWLDYGRLAGLLSKQHHRADERRYSATYKVQHGLVGELSGESLGELIRWRIARVHAKEQEDETANQQNYPN